MQAAQIDPTSAVAEMDPTCPILPMHLLQNRHHAFFQLIDRAAGTAMRMSGTPALASGAEPYEPGSFLP